MKIFDFLRCKSQILVLEIIVLLLFTLTVGSVSASESGVSEKPEENQELLNCLCSCAAPPGGQFVCSYNLEDKGWSPSCANLENGPCICKAYGCFRTKLPPEGECGDWCKECVKKCYEKYGVPEGGQPPSPPDEEDYDWEENWNEYDEWEEDWEDWNEYDEYNEWEEDWDEYEEWEEGYWGDEVTAVDIFNIYPERFRRCYDLPYAEIHKQPPPSERLSVGEEKKRIYDDLIDNGYQWLRTGFIPKGVGERAEEFPDLGLEPGDILMLGFDSLDPHNAPHYTVVGPDGMIYQVINWSEGGALDGPRSPEWLFKKRTLVNPFTGGTKTSPRIFQHYIIFRKE